MQPAAPPTSVFRAVVFALCSLFILVTPAYPEFFDRPHRLRFVHDWRMFAVASVNLFEVRFETGEGASRRELDRFTALGYESFAKAPRSVRTIQSVDGAWSMARDLCRKGHAPLYMRLRDATLRGWKVVEDGTRDVCKRPAPRARRSP